MTILMFSPAVVPVYAQPAFAPPAPLRIGVGGDYPDGLDGVLMARGLPHERIFPWELGDAAALKRYQVLLLSCPVATKGALDPALMDWIKAGGRAYIEVWAGMQGPIPLLELVGNAGTAPAEADTVLTATEHPILNALDRHLPINTFHLQGTFLKPRQPEQQTVLAQFAPDRGGTPYPYTAVFTMKLGEGELVYSGSPLSFCVFHRAPTTEPLLMNTIGYLCQGRAEPRLTTGAAEAEEDGETPAGGMPSTASAVKAPEGYELIEPEIEAPYNLAAQVLAAPEVRDRETVVLLDAALGADGKLKRPALWLVLGPQAVTLRAGASAKSPALASAPWQPPAEAQALLIRRRVGTVSVVLGDKELLATKTTVQAAGAVATVAGCATLMEAHCQPIEPPDFADDFMREAGDQSEWTTVSGDWRVVGLPNGNQSVNGFYFRGTGTDTAVAATGEGWWEDYCASAAVRLDGAGTCGLVALRHGNGDYVALTAEAATLPEAALKLVEVRGGQETVLAQRPGGIAPGQWYRLSLRTHAGQLEALLDGEPVLQAAQPDARGGGIGLMVRGGGARFDDVMVQPADRPLASPRNEGTPNADMPPAPGPQDTMTWANLAAPWAASMERPSVLWHVGSFAEDVTVSVPIEASRESLMRRLILAPSKEAPEAEWFTVTATAEPDGEQALITVAGKEKRVAPGKGGKLSLIRSGGSLAVMWNKETVWRGAAPEGLRSVGLEVLGPPVAVEQLRVIAPQSREYVFGVAPVDWHVSAGTWEVASRWACDSRWSWYAGWGTGDFAVWNKHRADGDVVVDCFMGIKMEAPGGGETARCRDTNITLCGDKANPRASGYSFIMGGDGGVKTQLLRNGVVVAESADMRVPAGYSVHHQWYHLRAARIGNRLELDFEGRPVLRYEDPEPLPGGFAGLWSRDSGILVPRVDIYQ